MMFSQEGQKKKTPTPPPYGHWGPFFIEGNSIISRKWKKMKEKERKGKKMEENGRKKGKKAKKAKMSTCS